MSTNVENKLPLNGRRAIPPNYSNDEENEVPEMEAFGVIPRGFNPRGTVYISHKSILTSSILLAQVCELNPNHVFLTSFQFRQFFLLLTGKLTETTCLYESVSMGYG